MGSHVIVTGHLFVAAAQRRVFLDAWGEGFVEDHAHTWGCVARYLGDATIARLRDGSVAIAVERWCDLDYLAAALLERLAPHIHHARLELDYEFAAEDEGWTVEIDEGRLCER